MIRKLIWECPFCSAETIKVAIRPTVNIVKRTGMRSGKKTQLIKSSGETIILSEECSNCKKSRKEIMKKYKEIGYI
ncbi:MAG: hypothetical protein RMJ17_00270 [Candidatus Aenigmarchaeota archaeon]|nr:hypothetical protein [Candidatus Aenigmarchaeota archaeon]MDW8149025.1 hypothetical protein [Candidatus Aenigmarchaeota archaeon]